ncbi:MAG: GLPGLI family protein [Siphonobacter sp.]
MKYLFTILVLSTCQMAYSQQKLAGKFTYEVQSKEEGKVVDSQTEDLFYNGIESVHVIYGKKNGQELSDTLRTNNDAGMNLMIAKHEQEDLVYYKNYKTHQMQSTEILANEQRCYVRDTIPVLKWVLIPEKKQIGPYLCQKATTTFRCASYEAWFATAIPLPIGPWKIGGLPGLIVELTNERMNITYKLVSAEYPLDAVSYPIVAPKPKKGPIYSFKAFAALQLKEQEKFRIFAQSSVPEGAVSTVVFNSPECYDEK